MREFIDNYILHDLQFKCEDLKEEFDLPLAIGFIIVIPVAFWSILVLLTGLL